MRCPFLREAQVKSCTTSAPRKLIVRTPDDELIGERCSSRDYVRCPAVKEFHEEVAHRTHCPFLHETLVQYCSASPVTRFVPYSESTLTRCGTENHRYCELYLSFRHPGQASTPIEAQEKQPGQPREEGQRSIEGIAIPEWMWYSENHLWLDVSEDGRAHVGIDGLLARAIGRVDAISYPTPKGRTRPAVTLTVAGVDLHLEFPLDIVVEGTNGHLRTHCEKLTSHPYTLGWLFEGTTPRTAGESPTIFPGLKTGNDALRWMEHEITRLSDFTHACTMRSESGATMQFMADGGAMCTGFLRQLPREEILATFIEFFSPRSTPGGLR